MSGRVSNNITWFASITLCTFGCVGVGVFWSRYWAFYTIESAGGTVQVLTADAIRGKLAVTLPDTVTDEALEQMAALDRLRPVWLQLRGRQIGGRGLESLKRLDCLVGLTLNGTSISDHDLSHLQAFPHLETLNLEGSAITSQGLKHLQSLPSLKCVAVRFTSLTYDDVLCLQSACPNVLVLSNFTDGDD